MNFGRAALRTPPFVDSRRISVRLGDVRHVRRRRLSLAPRRHWRGRLDASYEASLAGNSVRPGQLWTAKSATTVFTGLRPGPAPRAVKRSRRAPATALEGPRPVNGTLGAEKADVGTTVTSKNPKPSGVAGQTAPSRNPARAGTAGRSGPIRSHDAHRKGVPRFR